MSYDVYLHIDTGGPEPAVVGDGWNQTSNVAPMWRRAGADIAEFNGVLAGECVPVLRTAIAEMVDRHPIYIEMQPANGWGSYDSCLRFLRELLEGFEQHPKATVVVSC